MLFVAGMSDALSVSTATKGADAAISGHGEHGEHGSHSHDGFHDCGTVQDDMDLLRAIEEEEHFAEEDQFAVTVGGGGGGDFCVDRLAEQLDWWAEVSRLACLGNAPRHLLLSKLDLFCEW